MLDTEFDLLWRSGEIVPSRSATVHVRSVGHASASAVFEGINAYWNPTLGQLHVFRLRDHLERLAQSTRLAHLGARYSVDTLEEATIDLLRRNEVRRDVHIRPWSFVAGDPTEQMAAKGADCETVIEIRPFSSGLAEDRTRTAAVTSWRRIGADTVPPRIKAFANYHNGRLGNIDARERGADWPIFLNERGEVTESSGAAIGLFEGGTFSTPDLACGLLHSITRETVLDLLRTALDVPVMERSINRSDLYLADEIVFIGTSAEVLPIVEVDGFPIGTGTIGPMTRKLRAEYAALVLGERPNRRNWLSPVWSANNPDDR